MGYHNAKNTEFKRFSQLRMTSFACICSGVIRQNPCNPHTPKSVPAILIRSFTESRDGQFCKRHWRISSDRGLQMWNFDGDLHSLGWLFANWEIRDCICPPLRRWPCDNSSVTIWVGKVPFWRNSQSTGWPMAGMAWWQVWNKVQKKMSFWLTKERRLAEWFHTRYAPALHGICSLSPLYIHCGETQWCGPSQCR